MAIKYEFVSLSIRATYCVPNKTCVYPATISYPCLPLEVHPFELYCSWKLEHVMVEGTGAGAIMESCCVCVV